MSGVLYMALELGSTTWLVATSTTGRTIRTKAVQAGDLMGLRDEVRAAKKRFRLRQGAFVRSVYEAGRDGFWLTRALIQLGIDNLVVDSASIEVNRRRRRVKTDRVDAKKLLQQLVRYHDGDADALAVVEVPEEAAEDLRRISRERARLKKERTQLCNRIRGHLTAQGVRIRGGVSKLAGELDTIQRWDGSALPPHLHAELTRALERLALVEQHLKALGSQQKELTENGTEEVHTKLRRLVNMRGIGLPSAWVLITEFFGWREFYNRKEVGALAGLTCSPYHSDGTRRDQGISKAGNHRIRALMTELSWLWLRFQPDSQLTHWFNSKWASGAKRSRRVGIVALARKLLIALWRYVEQDVVPEGAVLKAAA